jgi:CRISPR-associated endonuclease/helicase Cas3
MAGETTRPGHATRSVETTRGLLTYAELAPLLAERVLRVEEAIAGGQHDAGALDGSLLCALHSAIAHDLVPAWAGRWRDIAVQVGTHEPPSPHAVPMAMHDYAANLATRLATLPREPDELWLETLAYAEGRLLTIHPFQDFNGRVTRLFLRLLLRRLNLPPVDLVPADEAGATAYLSALRAGDQLDWRPLMQVWRQRLANPLP